MTCFNPNSSLLRTLRALVRACMVAFMAIPGAGFALLAVACGDIDLGAEPMGDAVRVVDVHRDTAPLAMPSLPSPTPVDLEPVVDERPSLILPLEELAEVEYPEAFDEDCCCPDGEQEVPSAPSTLRIIEGELAHGVSNRQPIGGSDSFEVGDKVWAWVSVANTGDKAPITMVWRRDGVVRSRMTLDVGKSPRWRTWSRLKLRSYDVGTWTVDILDSSDNLLDVLRFDVDPGPVDVTLQTDFIGC